MIRTDTISDTADFFDELGGDSLDSLDVAVHLEEICGQRVPEEEYALCRCVEDAALLLLRLEQGSVPEAAPEEKKTVTPITRFEDTPEYAAFQQRLRTADETGNPYFLCNDSPLRDTSLHDGREILNFSSYNYAGMSGRPETVKAAQEAAAHYGCSASASRLLGGEKPIHKKLENAIAAWKHTEDAVVLVGGHSTNVTIVGNFCGKGDLIIYDALAHNSIHEGTRLSDAESRPFPHNDTAALETILRSCRDKYAKVLIVAEGVYSMDGDIAPVPELVRIKKEYGCFLMIDEAHSACVLGRTGGGVDEYFGLAGDDIDIKRARSPRVSAPAADTLRAAARSSSICATTCRGSCSPWAFRPRSPRRRSKPSASCRRIPPLWKACTGTSAASVRRRTSVISTPVLRAKRRYCRSSSGATRTPSRSRWRFWSAACSRHRRSIRRAARQGAAALLRHLRAQAGADRNGARHPAGDRRGTRHQTA